MLLPNWGKNERGEGNLQCWTSLFLLFFLFSFWEHRCHHGAVDHWRDGFPPISRTKRISSACFPGWWQNIFSQGPSKSARAPAWQAATCIIKLLGLICFLIMFYFYFVATRSGKCLTGIDLMRPSLRVSRICLFILNGNRVPYVCEKYSSKEVH